MSSWFIETKLFFSYFALFNKEYLEKEIQRQEGCKAIWGLSSVPLFFNIYYVHFSVQT